MEIRSITLFSEPDLNRDTAVRFCQSARTAFSYPVQTTRLALPPFPGWWRNSDAAQIAAGWQAAGADYISLGPVQLSHADAWVQQIPGILSASDALFATIEIADGHGRLSLERCQQTANVIRQVSALRDNGFGNLYLAAIANCPPSSPFFPVAYHAGGPPRFALAVEAADLAVTAFANAKSLAEARRLLVQAIEFAAADMEKTAVALAQQHNIQFGGIDFSLAPFPTDDKSLGGAMEALGLPHVGAHGSLFTAAFITETIARANFTRCGFSGLMLPVLEDSVLARRAAEGKLSVTDLLSYAAVCGVGLDTIPLPGDVPESALTGILLDVAALAVRLDKPLTARLMPLPGLKAGDPVTFDFPYFADSRVMAANGGVRGLLARPSRISIETINNQR